MATSSLNAAIRASVSAGSGPVAPDYLQYPEYRQAAWNYPDGDLQIDQRHRARLWVNYGIPKVDGLMVSFLQTLETGTPFGPRLLLLLFAEAVFELQVALLGRRQRRPGVGDICFEAGFIQHS